MLPCIWCTKLNASTAVEHIIPEALGCPNGFVLKDGAVCESCNNNLGHLDQAVLDEFDMLVFLAGVKESVDDHQRLIAVAICLELGTNLVESCT
jgi:HNH endonuclease